LHSNPQVGRQDVTPKKVLHRAKVSHNGKKEYKIHQVKMLQRDKMPFRDEMSQFMGKIIII
jgi:hypothetical protein